MRSYSLYWNTLRYLRPVQITSRVSQALRSRSPWALRGLNAAAPSPRQGICLMPGARDVERWAESLPDFEAMRQRAEQILGGEFEILNEARAFTGPQSWSDPEASRLWHFNLHYFRYAPELAFIGRSTGDPRFARKLIELMESWIDANPLGRGDAWHPFVSSVRVANWITAIPLLNAELGDRPELLDRLHASLAAQVRFLERRLEYGLLANHLLEDALGLIFAGCYFEGSEAERWLRRGANILIRQLPEQILSDGGHFERSPMYHSLVLRSLLECLAVARNAGRGGSLPIEPTLNSMFSFLEQIRHPDGEIALFNDAAFGEAPAPGELFAWGHALLGIERYASCAANAGLRQRLLVGSPNGNAGQFDTPVESAALEDSGYYAIRAREGRDCLIADCGALGPDYQPGHAHADTLGFELSLDGRRVIVDSGVETYAEGPWREYFRSTRAHNTIAVDEQDQSVMWGSFRVAERARTRKERWEISPTLTWLQGMHDGYRRLPGGVIHRRAIACVDQRLWLILDELSGAGEHSAESYLHFAPGFGLHAEGKCITASDSLGELQVATFGLDGFEIVSGQESPIQGWYAPQFGRRIRNSVLAMRISSPLPVFAGAAIASGDFGSLSCEVESREQGLSGIIHMGQQKYHIDWVVGELQVIRQ